jgi:hypothetical protein
MARKLDNIDLSRQQLPPARPADPAAVAQLFAPGQPVPAGAASPDPPMSPPVPPGSTEARGGGDDG